MSNAITAAVVLIPDNMEPMYKEALRAMVKYIEAINAGFQASFIQKLFAEYMDYIRYFRRLGIEKEFSKYAVDNNVFI